MQVSSSNNSISISGIVSILDVHTIFEKIGKHQKRLNITIEKDAVIREPTILVLQDQVNQLNKNGYKLNLSIESQQQSKNDLTVPKSNNRKLENSLSFEQIGRAAHNLTLDVINTSAFIKKVFAEFGYIFANGKRARIKETVSQIDQTGFFAVGIISLVNFLIGIVIAYLMGNQLQYYGANIFVVDGVSVAMCRELSPILVAIVVAGRSGSAFAAQLGSMKLNQETDALEVMGLRTFQVLVIPRILGLMITLPFLVIIGDIFGILGGMFISNIHLDIGYSNFIERLYVVLKPKQIIVGLVKAPVFALFIAAIGCKLGLESEPNAVSIGRNTTKTVVQSIVSVILLNAAAAIIFTNLGI